ncbi:unnamed protein product [Orchesella dallaii]|uniref:Peptidase S1 domain-containing protein n=1 Tax=Orchesella dallaii TaxID=48710 RepID=A0ABP1RR45_9HEXA
MVSLHLAATTVILAIYLVSSADSQRPCGFHRNGCPSTHSIIYSDIQPNGRRTFFCCLKGSDTVEKQRAEAKACRKTECILNGPAECSSLKPRFMNGKKIIYDETVTDECAGDNDEVGEIALCCPTDSEDEALTTLLGVEPHQFPHFARVLIQKRKGQASCGGSIYNKRWILTASHCVVNKKLKVPAITDPSTVSVVLGSAISGTQNFNTYGAEKIVVHNKSSLLIKHSRDAIYDIALIKLDEDIQFSKTITSIPIAKTGFNPLTNADHAVIVGYGLTDTLKSSPKLQKADTLIRKDERQVRSDKGPYPQYKAHTNQLLFLGGYQDGIASPSASRGDSGGPAICRGDDGNAVLCGLTSRGHGTANQCEHEKTEEWCWPVAYVEIAFFHNWIVKHAGNQKRVPLLKEPLYGAPVYKGQYDSQVHIKSADGHICGGTLISKTHVLTAAHCVALDDGETRKNIEVTAGILNLRKVKEGASFEVKKVSILDGFSRPGENRGKRIAVFAANATSKDPFYENDLAVLELNGEVDINAEQIPKLATVDPGRIKNGKLATEVAFRTADKRFGHLSQRPFHILGHPECQRRISRLKAIGVDITVAEDILCGVERYSGGSICDRELGGGVFCKGAKGKEELCGVQAFRLCEFAVPTAFVNVAYHKDWIDGML